MYICSLFYAWGGGAGGPRILYWNNTNFETFLFQFFVVRLRWINVRLQTLGGVRTFHAAAEDVRLVPNSQ